MVQEKGVSDSSECWGLYLEGRKSGRKNWTFIERVGVSASGRMDSEKDRGV